MIFGNDSISEYSKNNQLMWMLMAFQAGVLNIGGFMACHRFVSHVTGFATFFGHEISQLSYGAAVGMLVVPLFFLAGSMLSAQMVDVRIKMKKKPRYYVSFGVMFILILVVLAGGVAGFFGVFGEPTDHFHDYLLLILLCLICGLQNGTISSVSRSVVRTTHLTGITTDLGIGIMRYINRHGIESVSETNIEHEIRANWMRVGIIISFVFGSLAGGLLFGHLQYWGFILPTLISGNLFLLMLIFRH